MEYAEAKLARTSSCDEFRYDTHLRDYGYILYQ